MAIALANSSYALNEYEVLASICEKSYYEFFREFAGEFIQERIIWNWHIEYLCGRLQRMMERVIRWKRSRYDLIVNIPPGETKSSIFSVAICPWMWTRMPKFKMISVTHTDLLGRDLSMKARDIVESEKYQRCWPHLTLRENANTVGKWDNNFGGWRLSVTVGGKSPTGFHAHAIFIDDPVDPEQAKSRAVIKTATDYCRTTVPSRRISAKKSPTIMIMQRLDNDDPAGDRLRNKEAGPVRHYCLPADDSWPIKPKSLRSYYRKRNGLLDRKRLDRRVLKTLRAQLGNFAYSGQYGQSPVPRGGLIFDVSKLEERISKDCPKELEIQRIIRYWDKAYSENTGAYTTGVLMCITKSNIYWLLDVVRFQKESYGRERIIRQIAEKDGISIPIAVEQEPAAGKESVQNTIRNLRGFKVTADRRGGSSDGNKIMRADPFATQVNAGNVWIREAPWNQAYIDELRFFSEKARYKDQVDASSGAFNLITNRVTIGGWK